ncbi:MAG: MmcQ/YjbR family DNA-binding protein [Pseudomonadota bacterium]
MGMVAIDRGLCTKICVALPGAQCVRQWGDAYVWKVGEKVFALQSYWGDETADGEPPYLCVKCTDLSYRMLIEEAGIDAAPYLGRYKWVQFSPAHRLSDDDLKAYIEASYGMIVAKLPRKLRQSLGVSEGVDS